MLRAIFGPAGKDAVTGDTEAKRGATVEGYLAFSKRVNSRYQRRGRKPVAPAKREGGERA